jgi:hypothetical protein
MNNKALWKVASLIMAFVMIVGNTGTTRAATNVALTAGSSIYWGAMVDGQAPSSTNLQGVFNTFETRSGKRMSIIHWGQPWMRSDGSWSEFQTSYFENVRSHGSIPMLNWTSWRLGGGTNQSNFQLRDIYNGTYDTYIRRWATDAKNWGHPFFLRFNHEGNGWWYPWGEGKTDSGAIVNGNSAGDFVRAWRHVHDIFTSVGATNVSWLWSMNHMSTSSHYPALSTLYPGDAYVDWTGLSAYNKYDTWAGLNPLLTGSQGMTWFRNSYNDILSVAPNKPMMLAEFGSFEAGDGGTKKAAWITDALTVQIPTNFPKLKAVVWMNWDVEGRSYPIETSQAATNAWSTGIRSTIYASNQFGSLNTSPIPPLANSLFYDVPSTYWATSFVEQLYTAGITGGCTSSPLQYCPEGRVTRAQMAVFLLRAIHGSSYSPPNIAGNTGFVDVPANYWAAAWIKRLAAEGITDGCENGKYCPEYPVTRDQMAVFLLRSKHGASYSPPAVGSGTGFGDVHTDHWAAAWIKELVAEGITGGCSNGNYCPGSVVSRAQMAVFLVKTFNLP